MYSPSLFNLLAEDFRRDRMNSRREFGNRPSRLAAILDHFTRHGAEATNETPLPPVRPSRPVSLRD
ncbi:MAG: hypothetical protein R3B97_09095 [Dehalococcoidia bacterium]|nr:hypothetical protein [Dehalococcoidia bacterium]MCB9486563.1 hypothetical protein [Thermoflexaceae bacterium]